MQKKSEEALAEIYRNCQLALTSIADMLPAVEDESVKNELKKEYDEYERISGRAVVLAADRGLDLKSPSPMKKAMMWSSIKMNTLTDNSRAHLAEMMVQGTVMGITALKSTLSDLGEEADEEILDLMKELLDREEQFEKSWKALIES